MAASTKTGINSRTAQDVIKQLNLSAHPEKGYFIETYRDSATTANGRANSTAIYYLLEGSVGPSNWHRVDATEVWHYYAGAPLKLEIFHGNDAAVEQEDKILGGDVFEGQHPQVAIEKKVWQRATSLGDWTLVGCTVAPGFVESGFEMAPLEWSPHKSK